MGRKQRRRQEHPQDRLDELMGTGRRAARFQQPARGRRHGGRLLDYGELRLLLIAMIAERACHGYELMKLIEASSGGRYTPSPGVLYPTLSRLEDMGYAVKEADGEARKRYRVTAEGLAFLAANRAAVDELGARIARAGSAAKSLAEPVLTAVERLKAALRERLQRGPLDAMAAQTLAAALHAAAEAVEHSG
jgi:DNA-binding PadR family transcriptional regulator